MVQKNSRSFQMLVRPWAPSGGITAFTLGSIIISEFMFFRGKRYLHRLQFCCKLTGLFSWNAELNIRKDGFSGTRRLEGSSSLSQSTPWPLSRYEEGFCILWSLSMLGVCLHVHYVWTTQETPDQPSLSATIDDWRLIARIFKIIKPIISTDEQKRCKHTVSIPPSDHYCTTCQLARLYSIVKSWRQILGRKACHQ